MPKFIRFVVAGKRHTKWRRWASESLDGVFTIAEQERKKKRLSKENKKIVTDTFKWFNGNIPTPPYKANKWDIYASCWWRTTAKLPIKKLRPLIQTLRKHGMVVRTLHANNFSKVLYRDKYQVVAIY